MPRPLPDIPGVPVRHRWIQAGDVSLHVAEAGEGDGPPFVLLHGWPQHWYAWREVIGPLAREHRVLCPDLRGYGWSEARRTGYDKETLAADIVALLDALGLERVRFVGHDWGGWIGFLLALHHPGRIERLLALGIVHPWFASGRRPQVRALASAWYQFVLASPGLSPYLQRRTDVVARALPSGRIWSDEARETFAAAFREPGGARAAQLTYREFLLREVPALVAGRYDADRLTVPTHLVVGRTDPVITPDAVSHTWRRHADDMTVEWVDAGHFIPEELPGLVVERALDPGTVRTVA